MYPLFIKWRKLLENSRVSDPNDTYYGYFYIGLKQFIMSMQPPENAKLFDAPNGTVWMDEDGIIYSVPKPNERAPTREESEYQIALFKKLTNNEKKCIIVETNPKDPLPKKEDRDWVSAELESIMIAMAVIYTSPVGRMMANLFFGFKPATYPMKFFSNEKDAKEWIKQYLPKK